MQFSENGVQHVYKTVRRPGSSRFDTDWVRTKVLAGLVLSSKPCINHVLPCFPVSQQILKFLRKKPDPSHLQAQDFPHTWICSVCVRFETGWVRAKMLAGVVL